MQANVILLVLTAIGYVAHNTTVTAASLILFVLKALLPEEKMLYFGTHGMSWGIIILTAAVMIPLAMGKIGTAEIISVFKSPEGLLSITIGVLVALFGKWGLQVMAADPQIVVSSLVGTIIGVVVLKGVPVGPMIASGMLYMMMRFFRLVLH